MDTSIGRHKLYVEFRSRKAIESMSTRYYKQFMRLAARWPKDPLKGADRDPALFIEREIDRLFRKEVTQLPKDPSVCDRRLRSTVILHILLILYSVMLLDVSAR
ncbi:hypothetical protein AB6A40_010168 [Gnathostoma spinigerum]|uniref:Mitochondrial protein M19 n=1 Tax=Gnathostoma spinigerum TaxID=75299 RepID=A0ABD6EU06_9BILA